MFFVPKTEVIFICEGKKKKKSVSNAQFNSCIVHYFYNINYSNSALTKKTFHLEGSYKRGVTVLL